MATDITLALLATRTTTTLEEVIGNVRVQPREVDTDAAGDAVDLGDNRSVSLRLEGQRTQDGSLRCATLYAWIETANSELGPWVPVSSQSRPGDADAPTFDRVHLSEVGTFSQQIGFVSPGQFIRARWKIATHGGTNKLEARFGITGRATGAAT